MNEHFSPARPGRPSRDEVYQRLDTQITELWQRMGGLPNPREAADIWRDIWFEEAHHSTAIEGNTLVLKQVETLLAEGRAIGNKELRKYMWHDTGFMGSRSSRDGWLDPRGQPA